MTKVATWRKEASPFSMRTARVDTRLRRSLEENSDNSLETADRVTTSEREKDGGHVIVYSRVV